jgi:hypothetical protein
MFPMSVSHIAQLRGLASGIVDGNKGDYTEEMFLTDFPQFKNKDTGENFIPASIMPVFLNMVNDMVSPERWGSLWQLAAGLFLAHYATLYLKTIQNTPNGSSNLTEVTAAGQLFGIVNSATLGDASISYDTNAATALTQDWGQWNLTAYGQQYASLAIMVVKGGCYVQ